MLKIIAGGAIAAGILLSHAALAEPVKLKFSLPASDRSSGYVTSAKPFTDAVNSAGKDLVKIEIYAGGVLGNIAQQAQLVADGTADLALVIPGYSPQRFYDNEITGLPGIYQNMREATLAYTHLIAVNALKGYEDFVVIGAFMSEPEVIHTRLPVRSLEDLKGKRICVGSPMEAAALEKLGIIPVKLPLTEISDALSNGKVDGVLLPFLPVLEFGIGRIATSHYTLKVAAAPILVLMNRKKFESLTPPTQDIIRKYSGEWLAEQFITIRQRISDNAVQELKSHSRREIITPTLQDTDAAQAEFEATVQAWARKNIHNRELLSIVETKLAEIRKKQ